MPPYGARNGVRGAPDGHDLAAAPSDRPAPVPPAPPATPVLPAPPRPAPASPVEWPPEWAEWAAAKREEIISSGRWRAPVPFDALGVDGSLPAPPTESTPAAAATASEAPDARYVHVVAFASNDYLGLGAHPQVVSAARQALSTWGAGAGASRLLSGTRPVHEGLERDLAEWKDAEAAVVFPSGYAANIGVLVSLGEEGCHVFSDELNHASIVDGARLARAGVSIYRHRDVGHLDALIWQLRRRPSAVGPPRRILVVTDSVFSMDGDLAPLDDLCECCERHGALLVIDEAHAVLGPELDPSFRHVVRVGTLSKTLGSAGGFAAGSRTCAELLVNRARSYIFSTAPTPASMASAKTALGILRSEEGSRLKATLSSHIAHLLPGNPSPIVPVVLGPEELALQASRELLARGMWVPAIRPPTVPEGTSRLRISLSAAHSTEQVLRLSQALQELRARSGRAKG